MFKTSDGKILNVQEIYWDKIRPKIRRLNPELAQIIDQLSPDNDYPFYLVSYPFGAPIIHNSLAYLPTTDGQNLAFNDPRIPQILIDNLGYMPETDSPLGMILSKNSECYRPTNKKIVPHTMLTPGCMFGLGRVLENAVLRKPREYSSPAFTWEMSAGARSIFILAKISNSIAYSKLKKELNLLVKMPTCYEEQWDVFKEIAQNCNNPWQQEVLYFSNKWLDNLGKPEFATLYSHLSNIHLSKNKVWHMMQSWAPILNEIESDKRLDKHSSCALNTAKHLFAVVGSGGLGSQPTTNDDSAPNALIQDVIVNIYGLSDQCPTIMEPTYFNNESLYCSLAHLTFAWSNSETFKGKSMISNLDELCYVEGIYRNSILSGNYTKVESLYAAVKSADFGYYHDDPGAYKNIKNNIMLPTEDPRFICGNIGTKGFPEHSSFLKGCIKITPTK
jgi:hypothetical protein